MIISCFALGLGYKGRQRVAKYGQEVVKTFLGFTELFEPRTTLHLDLCHHLLFHCLHAKLFPSGGSQGTPTCDLPI